MHVLDTGIDVLGVFTKDGHVDQIVTDGASVVINFDGITGNHMITIDTSVDVAYSTGSEYEVRIEGATVDAGIINGFIGTFSIERTGGVLAVLKTINIANGAIESDLTYIHGSALTETAGQLAGRFKDFFDQDASGYNVKTALSAFKATGFATPTNITAGTITTVTNNSDMRGTDGANTVVPPSVAQFNARSIPSNDYVVVGDTIARVTLVDTVTTNSDLVTAAAVVTAMEANNTLLDYLATDLIYKKSITIANGNSIQYDKTDTLIGTIATGYADDGTTVFRKNQVQVKV